MIKLLKTVFKVMIFIAKATWFCLIFVILYALIRDFIETYEKKRASQEMAEEILSDENLNKDPHEKKEPEDA